MIEKDLKVVHISTSVSGGAGNAAYRIHQALLERSFSSTFLSLSPSVNSNVDSHFQLQKPIKSLLKRAFDKFIRITERYFKWKLSKNIYYHNRIKEISSSLHAEWTSLPFSNYNILSHPAVKEADIIHLHWISGMLDYPSFFKDNIKPVIWTLHDMNSLQGIFHYKGDEVRNEKAAKSLNKEIYTFKEKLVAKSKSKILIVTPSEWLSKTVLNSTMFSNSKVTTIKNPIDTSQYHRYDTQDLKQKLNIAINNTIFLFIAQDINTYRKGFDLITEALNQLNNEHITLIVIGVAHNFQMAKFQVVELGSVYDKQLLCRYYSLADAFVIPSREDNLPNVMLEAMACGTPILSFNIGGMAETIEDGFNGLKASELKASSFKETLERFILNKAKFNHEFIREFVILNFSYDAISKKYIDLYKSCLRG